MSQLINDLINQLRAQNEKLVIDLQKYQKLNELLSKYRLYFKQYLKVCKCKQTLNKSLIEIKIQSLEQLLNEFESQLVNSVRNEFKREYSEEELSSMDDMSNEEVDQLLNVEQSVTFYEGMSQRVSIDSRLKCELLGCDKTFSTKNSLCIHMNRYHKNGKDFQCLKCDQCFRKRPELVSHQEIHKNFDQLFISTRSVETNNKTNNWSEDQNDSTEAVSHLDVVLMTTEEEVILTNNQTQDLSSSGLPINEEMDAIEEHSNDGQNSKQLSENDFNNEFSSFVRNKIDAKLKKYEPLLKGKRFVCTWPSCGHTARNRQDLVLHIRRKHTFEKPFHCDQCHKSFELEKVLNQHKRVHSHIKFKCDFEGCPYQSPYEWDLRAHRNQKHLSKERFHCDIDGCPKNYKYQADLKAHQKLSHRQ